MLYIDYPTDLENLVSIQGRVFYFIKVRQWIGHVVKKKCLSFCSLKPRSLTDEKSPKGKKTDTKLTDGWDPCNEGPVQYRRTSQINQSKKFFGLKQYKHLQTCNTNGIPCKMRLQSPWFLRTFPYRLRVSIWTQTLKCFIWIRSCCGELTKSIIYFSIPSPDNCLV